MELISDHGRLLIQIKKYLESTLRQKDFSAFMEQAEIGGKQVFRVRVGPVVDHGQAEKMLVGLNRELKPMKLKGELKRYP